MLKTAIIGFDSAWTDNQKQPGAISALVLDNQGWSFIQPRLASFSEAECFIHDYSADLQIITLDQPTIVVNETSCRPVDRIAGSIVNKLGGGVQPANCNKAAMFGDDAPVWRFINNLRPIQHPFLARDSQQGCFLIEVFPALALPTLVPAIWKRGRGAKYNPGLSSKFSLEDWGIVCHGLAEISKDEQLASMAEFLEIKANLGNPQKAHQDRLDSIICTLIGYIWLKYGTERCCVVGDSQSGFMLTPADQEIEFILKRASIEKGVPFDEPEQFSGEFIPSLSQDKVGSTPTQKNLNSNTIPEDKSIKSNQSEQPTGFSYDAVYQILIEAAKKRIVLTYGDVFTPFGIKANSFSVVGRLVPILNKIALDNIKRGEPLLSALVIAKTTGHPGDGFYQHVRTAPSTSSEKIQLAKREQQKVFDHNWRVKTASDQSLLNE